MPARERRYSAICSRGTNTIPTRSKHAGKPRRDWKSPSGSRSAVVSRRNPEGLYRLRSSTWVPGCGARMVGSARAARGSLCGDSNGALRGNPNGEWRKPRYRIAPYANAGAPPFLLSGFRTGRPRLRFHENMKTGSWRFSGEILHREPL